MFDGKVHLQSIGLLSLVTVFLITAPGCTNPEKRVEQKLAEAEQKFAANEPAEAFATLEELHRNFPERLDIIETLAFAYARNGQPAEAADAFVKAAALDPVNGDYLMLAAQARETAGDPDRAAGHYRVHLTDHFDDDAAWNALAELEKKRGLHQNAIDAYLHVYRIRPTAATATRIGDLFFELRNLAQAHHWFTAALEQPGQPLPETLTGLLRIHMEEGDWERSQELVERLERDYPETFVSPEFAEIRTGLARWRESLEELERLRRERAELAARREAERLAREEAERIEREEAEAAAIAAAEAERQAELERRAAEEAAAEANGEEPEEIAEEETVEDAAAAFARLTAEADRLFEARRYRTAAQTYWRALTHNPESAETWFDVSRAQFLGESWNDAELTALEALRREPENEAFHLHYLNVIQQTQPVRAYLRELERVHQQFPANADVVLALANTYARSLYSHQEAVRYYHRFLRLAPDDARTAEVRESIRRLTER